MKIWSQLMVLGGFAGVTVANSYLNGFEKSSHSPSITANSPLRFRSQLPRLDNFKEIDFGTQLGTTSGIIDYRYSDYCQDRGGGQPIRLWTRWSTPDYETMQATQRYGPNNPLLSPRYLSAVKCKVSNSISIKDP